MYEQLHIQGCPDIVHVNWYGTDDKPSGIGAHSDIKEVDPNGPVLTYTLYKGKHGNSPMQVYPFNEHEYKNIPTIEKLGYNIPTYHGSVYGMHGIHFQTTCVHGMHETVAKRMSLSVRMSKKSS